MYLKQHALNNTQEQSIEPVPLIVSHCVTLLNAAYNLQNLSMSEQHIKSQSFRDSCAQNPNLGLYFSLALTLSCDLVMTISVDYC